MKAFFAVLIFLAWGTVLSQTTPIPQPPSTNGQPQIGLYSRKDSLGVRRDAKGVQINVKDYKIISHRGDSTFLDTTLTIQKEYKHNYIRKDDFELLPFSNIGAPYNKLGKTGIDNNFYPQIGAVGRHYNYLEAEDIAYYHVPTPLTDIQFKSVLDQGQLLDALLTFNTSKQFNAMVAFRGFRSLGQLQFNQVESRNFRTGVNYRSKNKRYWLRAHIAAQASEVEENGGLSDPEGQFESGDDDFSNRTLLDVRFTDAVSTLEGRRYFFEHKYVLFNDRIDSVRTRKTNLSFGHQFNFETKFYQFRQTGANSAFGDNPITVPIDDQPRLRTVFNEVNAEFSNTTLGTLKAKASLYNYNYFFNSIFIDDTQVVPSQLTGDEIAIGGEYAKDIGGLSIRGDVNVNVVGELTGSLLNASLAYQINKDNVVWGAIHSSSRLPNFNFLLYQSDYRNYNWVNTETFEPKRVQTLSLGLNSKTFGNYSAEISRIDNHTFFRSTATDEQFNNGQELAFVQPFQENNTINHFRIKGEKEFRLKNWALNNTVLFQNVTQDEAILNVPTIVTRNTLYYSKHLFNKALFLQTGITVKYFTAHAIDSYNPLLGEFFVQDREEIGNFPLMDFFINAKVRTARLFLKAEHFNSSFTGFNFYSAPNYPYRDFVIRFGVVWNFFS